MRVHHLNCGTLRPLGGAWVHGVARPWQRTRLVTHVLLVETPRGLVLVDSGIGAADVDGRRGRLHARHLRMLIWAQLDTSEPAIAQLRARGFDPRDVSDIVLTHLDLDHAGGLADFPAATVHVRADELERAIARRTIKERARYAPIDWAHGPKWHIYNRDEAWRDLRACEVDGFSGDILLVPLPGHTLGHAGVAVRTQSGWMLHAGDALIYADELRGITPPRAIDLFTTHVASIDDIRRRSTRDSLRRLGSDVQIVCSHDPVLFDQLAGEQAVGVASGSSVRPGVARTS